MRELAALLERVPTVAGTESMTRHDRAMLWAIACYVFIDGLPKVEAFAVRAWSWLN